MAPKKRISVMRLMRTSNGRRALKARKAEARSRRKGREQREAAEQGKTVRFYVKEIARKRLNPVHRSAHFEK